MCNTHKTLHFRFTYTSFKIIITVIWQIFCQTAQHTVWRLSAHPVLKKLVKTLFDKFFVKLPAIYCAQYTHPARRISALPVLRNRSIIFGSHHFTSFFAETSHVGASVRRRSCENATACQRDESWNQSAYRRSSVGKRSLNSWGGHPKRDDKSKLICYYIAIT